MGYPPVVPEEFVAHGFLRPVGSLARSLAVDVSGHRSAHPLLPVVFSHSPAPDI
ncbi:hypothetical protein P376_1380 [Streptomyces sp. HCCB10043]|nr:hypothetical protein P376_1380 [Streptomyces sp. HCCB10043]